jgi:hypothetical protein
MAVGHLHWLHGALAVLFLQAVSAQALSWHSRLLQRFEAATSAVSDGELRTFTGAVRGRILLLVNFPATLGACIAEGLRFSSSFARSAHVAASVPTCCALLQAATASPALAVHLSH